MQVLLRWGLQKGCLVIPKRACSPPAWQSGRSASRTALSCQQQPFTALEIFSQTMSWLACQPKRIHMQVLLRWGLQKGCLVIPKSVQPARVAEWTHGKLHSFELPASAMTALDGLEDGTKYCWDPQDVA